MARKEKSISGGWGQYAITLESLFPNHGERTEFTLKTDTLKYYGFNGNSSSFHPFLLDIRKGLENSSFASYYFLEHLQQPQ